MRYILSCWIKPSVIASNGTFFSRNYGGNPSQWLTNNSGGFGRTESGSTKVLWNVRDYAGWYHVFVKSTTQAYALPATGDVFINGVPVVEGAQDLMGLHPTYTTFRIGARAKSLALWWTGLLADFHLLTGPGSNQTLNYTDFGEFNNQGIWIPRDPGITGGSGVLYNGAAYNDTSAAYIYKEWDGNFNTSTIYIKGDTVNPSVLRVNLQNPIVGATNIKFHGGDYFSGNNWILKVDGVQVGTGVTSASFADEESVSFSARDINFIELEGTVQGVGLGNVKVDDTLLPNPNEYGTLGFHLDFSDPADIGADRSGNENDFAPTGFELADPTSENYDYMDDTPTQNFATMNPILPPKVMSGLTITESLLTGQGRNTQPSCS